MKRIFTFFGVILLTNVLVAQAHLTPSDTTVTPSETACLDVEASYIEWQYVYTRVDSVPQPTAWLTCASHDAYIEWVWIENYNEDKYNSTADFTKREIYHVLQRDTVYDGDRLESVFTQFDSTMLDRQYLWRYVQCGEERGSQLFVFQHAMQVDNVTIGVEVYRVQGGDSVPHEGWMYASWLRDSVTPYVNWFDVNDKLTPVEVFEQDHSYYAEVATPMDSLFEEGYVLNSRTRVSWNGTEEWSGNNERGSSYDMSGVLRSPVITVADIVWMVALGNYDNLYDINATVITRRDSIEADSVCVELAGPDGAWYALHSDSAGMIYIDKWSAHVMLPAYMLTVGTWSFRFTAFLGEKQFVSRVYTVTIAGGIEIDEYYVSGGMAYDEATNTLALTAAVVSGGEDTTAVAINNSLEDLTISLSGENTIAATKVGVQTNANITIEGAYEKKTTEQGGDTMVATSSLVIVAPRPLYTAVAGVKLTLDGVYLHLVIPGHEGDACPGRVAARRQLPARARLKYVAQAALITQDASGESVISGFDEIDFINCGVIEPEGAEYDDEDLSLVVGGDPVYNCTIIPMDIPVIPTSVETTEAADTLSAEKRLSEGTIQLVRQGRTYTILGQRMK